MQARVSSVIAVSPDIILTENGQAHSVVLPAPTVSVELRIDSLRDKKPSRQRVARLVGVGSRFKDIDRPIGIRQLFFLRLLSGTKQVRSEFRQGRTSVSESDAVDEFDSWVKLGLIIFNKGKIGRKREEEESHTRLNKSWNGFKAQMGSISPTLGGLFDAEWPDSTSKVYAIGLVPGAVEDRLCDSVIPDRRIALNSASLAGDQNGAPRTDTENPAGYQGRDRLTRGVRVRPWKRNNGSDTELRIRAFCPGIFAFLAVSRVVEKK